MHRLIKCLRLLANKVANVELLRGIRAKEKDRAVLVSNIEVSYIVLVVARTEDLVLDVSKDAVVTYGRDSIIVDHVTLEDGDKCVEVLIRSLFTFNGVILGLSELNCLIQAVQEEYIGMKVIDSLLDELHVELSGVAPSEGIGHTTAVSMEDCDGIGSGDFDDDIPS